MISIRTLSLAFLSALISTSCGVPGRVTSYDGTIFSEYYQCLIYAESEDYSFDALWTLGKERLPEDHVFSDSDAKYLRAPDTIEEVLEVYIRNHSEELIHVKLLKVGSGIGNAYTPYSDVEFEVQPGKWAKSDPDVDVTSVYGPDIVPCWINFEIDGTEVTLNGTKRRLTLDELSR